jgi:hypothetical protein
MSLVGGSRARKSPLLAFRRFLGGDGDLGTTVMAQSVEAKRVVTV